MIENSKAGYKPAILYTTYYVHVKACTQFKLLTPHNKFSTTKNVSLYALLLNWTKEKLFPIYTSWTM